jgi:hypothetical protein
MLLRSNDLFPMLFNEVFNNVNDGWNKNSARDPQINILEGQKDYKIEICVPGRNKSDLSLTIDTDNNLVISMEHHTEVQKAEATATDATATADATAAETPVVKAEPKASSGTSSAGSMTAKMFMNSSRNICASIPSKSNRTFISS